MTQDIRYALRSLRLARSFSVWVIASLAIGMAAAIAALAVLNAALLLPFPGITDQHRLVRLTLQSNCGRPDCWAPMATADDYREVRDSFTTVQGVAAYTIEDVALAVPDARTVRGIVASANYFDVLGVRPSVGRLFSRTDEEAGAPIAVLSHGLWTREFDADPAIIGRWIRAGDEFVQVVGVAPELFAGVDRPRPAGRRRMGLGRPPDVWLPLWLADRILPDPAASQQGRQREFQLVARVDDAAGLQQVEAEATAVAQRLVQSSGRDAGPVRADVRRVWRVDPRHWTIGILVVMPIPILVLAIACVNAANLMLARGSRRQRELAVRLAIGAARGRLVRELLIESALLTALATAVAVPIAAWSLELLSSPFGTPIPVNVPVLGLTIVVDAATTIACGLAPALRVTAQSPSSALGAAGARSDAVPAQSRMRRALLAAQVALSLALLAAGSQLVSTVQAQSVSGGAPADQLLIARFDLEPLKLPAAEIDTFYRDLLAGASRLPGVAAAGMARHTSVWSFGQGSEESSLAVWRDIDPPDQPRVVAGGVAEGDLFGAVGLRVLEGRGFTDADRQARPQVAVVNTSAARLLNGPAIGSLVRVAPRGRPFPSALEVRVVGVIESAIEPRLEEDDAPPAKIYLPSRLEPEPALALYVRTNGKGTALAGSVRELVARVGPRVPIDEIGTLADFNERSSATQLWLARAAAVLGAIGLVLAAAGLYGMTSYLVGLRSRELAIRMALGAAPRSILSLVLRQSMRLAGIGLIVGGSAAIAVSRWIQSEFHGIHRLDAGVLALTGGVFVLAMFLASIVPAGRASRIDPVANLREG